MIVDKRDVTSINTVASVLGDVV